MLISSIVLIFVLLCFSAETFFIFKNKHEPILFCVKICPLYCSPRRRDEDASFLFYVDETDETPFHTYYEDDESHPEPHHFCEQKSKLKPTTPKPTTTERPYFYDYYEDFNPYPYRFCWKPKTTTTEAPTTKMSTTTEEPTWICMVCLKKCGYPPNA